MKITVGDEVLAYEFDLANVAMSQALAIEKAAGRRYVEWEAEVVGGSAEALAVLLHLAWKENGRDVPLADILGGKADFSFSDAYTSFMRALQDQALARAAAENPTSGAGPRTDPAGTPTMRRATKGSSPST